MRWRPRFSPPEEVIARLRAEANISPLLARLLASRGVVTPSQVQQFLAPSFAHLHSPYAMLGMHAAVERLHAAVARQEKVLIYGDYDVDGTIAIVVLKVAIEVCGGTCEFHVPHRIRDGYGMKDEVIERAASEGVRLIISVDTGIRAFTAAETARRLGLDLIVTDHHLPQAEGVPRAVSVLNPNQPGCEYPCKQLCGAGVAFKLAQALLEKVGFAKLLPSFLKVVAIATIADAVPLVDENRVFAKLGLDGLRQPVNSGLKALMEVAQVRAGRGVSAGEVAFRLAPRLNAAGRMDVARDVVDLFSVREIAKAREIAGRLNQLNLQRQQEEQRIVQEIETRIAADEVLRGSWCIVVDGENWHKGVIGIAATRVLERYCRPVLVIAREGAQAQGSARSIEAFHMLDALESCAHLFTRFGGHAHAAGFALPSELIPQLRAALDARARMLLHAEDLEPTLCYDTEITLEEITPDLYAHLRQMEPYGMGNPEPVFVARQLRLMAPPRPLREKHLKLRVRQATPPAAGPQARSNGRAPRQFDALAWNVSERIHAQTPAANDILDLAFTLVENPHPEFGGLELCICDLSKSAGATA